MINGDAILAHQILDEPLAYWWVVGAGSALRGYAPLVLTAQGKLGGTTCILPEQNRATPQDETTSVIVEGRETC